MRDAERHWIETVCVGVTQWEGRRGTACTGEKYETIPILFVELQHHVVSGNTEGASALVVRLLAI